MIDRGSNEFWAIIEALARAAYEVKVADHIVDRMVISLIRRGRVIDTKWVNMILAELKNREDEVNQLYYVIKASNPRLVERENYKEILEKMKNLQEEIQLGKHSELKYHSQEELVRVLNTKIKQFKNSLALTKSPEERLAYEEHMLLELD